MEEHILLHKTHPPVISYVFCDYLCFTNRDTGKCYQPDPVPSISIIAQSLNRLNEANSLILTKLMKYSCHCEVLAL